MTKKKQKKQEDRLNRKYTHPEFLKEFFPNIDPSELEQENESTLTQEQFFDVLIKVTSPLPSPLDEETSETSG